MLDRKIVAKAVFMVCENFNWKVSELYVDLVYKALNTFKITEEDVTKTIPKVIHGIDHDAYYTRVPIGTWLDWFNKKPEYFETKEEKNRRIEFDKRMDAL